VLSPVNARLMTVLQVLAVIVLAAVVLVGFIYLLGRLHTLATIIIAAVFLCYVMFPAVRRLNKRLPMWASIVIVYAAVGVVVVTALAFIVPAASAEVRQFVQDAPGIARDAEAALSDPNNPIGGRLPPSVRDYIASLPTEFVSLADRYGAAVTRSFFGVFVSAVSILAIFVIVPIAAIYLMIETDAMHRGFVSLIPPPARPKTLEILGGINAVLGGFIRGQLLVALIVGLLVAVMLTFLHVRFAILIGLVAGLLEVIPYVGAIAGAVPAVVISLVTNGPVNAVFVVIGFIIINQLEGHLIAPNIVGPSVGLPPLAVIVALLAGGELFGLLGLVVAVPIAGIIRVLFVALVPRYPTPEPESASLVKPDPAPLAIVEDG
jgi:predicted PurR-regulated permease PerM